MKRQRILKDLNDACQELGNRSVFMSHAVATEIGLNATDFECFDALRLTDRPVTAGELAQVTGLTTGAITGIVDRLEKAGFVERSPDKTDRRRIYVRPLMTMCQRIRELYGPLSNSFQELTKKYTEEELRLIHDFIVTANIMLHTETKRIRDNAEKSRRR